MYTESKTTPENITPIEELVKSAEQQRNRQSITALKRYVDNHPEIPNITLKLTEEIKTKLLFYVSSGNPEKEQELRNELEVMKKHIESLNEQPNIIHTLLSEEIQLSWLFLRHADTVFARHHSNLSSLTLRRMDTAQIRFLRALKTLANIHQRLPQVVHVNLGQQI